MGMELYLLAALPFAIAIGGKFFLRSRINWQEWAVIAVCSVLIVIGVHSAGRMTQTSATEVWNGQVVRVYDQKQECPWGWRSYRDGFCENYRTRSVYAGQICTGTGSSRTCTAQYDTEYRYEYDWERKYYVDLSLKGKTVRIPSPDEQGRQEPQRWQDAYVGEPASVTNSYTNWIKASSDSLFHESAKAAKLFNQEGLLPDYPNEIVDYYKVNRVIGVDVDVPNESEWEEKLGQKLAQLGPDLEMNAVLVFVDAKHGPKYASALRYHWEGFQKNDTVVVTGVKNQTDVNWVKVMSWSENRDYNSQLEARLEKVNKLDADSFLGHLQAQAIANYERRPMEEFKHLKAQMPTPTWVYILSVLFGILVPGGLIYFFSRVDFDPLGIEGGSQDN